MQFLLMAMYNFLGSIVTNTCLDVIFMFGLKMSVDVAALATAIRYIVSSILSLHFLI